MDVNKRDDQPVGFLGGCDFATKEKEGWNE